MKKYILLIILSLIFTARVNAQELTNQLIYDCSSTGRCSKADSDQEALYADNLAPGIVSKQHWNLENNSKDSCRVYLRLRSLDNEIELTEKISLSAVGIVDGKEREIIKPTKFTALLEKQSIYLGKLPKNSKGEIVWEILLDEDVDNTFQANQKKFSTLLYSYCLSDKKGQVAGVTTDSGSDLEKLVYASLALISLGILVWIKFK